MSAMAKKKRREPVLAARPRRSDFRPAADGPAWLIQSVAGRVFGRVLCLLFVGHPYPLIFMLLISLLLFLILLVLC